MLSVEWPDGRPATLAAIPHFYVNPPKRHTPVTLPPDGTIALDGSPNSAFPYDLSLFSTVRWSLRCYPNLQAVSWADAEADDGLLRATVECNVSMELARNLKTDSVSRLHPTPPWRIRPQQSVAEAVALMRQQRVGCVLVCRDDDHLIGLFTERDLMQRVLAAGLPLGVPVELCMTRDPVVVHPKDPIGVAVRRMEEGGYRHLPVVDPAGRPLGVLSVKRIVHYLAEHFPSTIYNQPPDPNAVPREAEGA